MFDISWTEFLLIGVVALIVIGPKELPGVMRTLGQYTRKVRSMAADFQNQFQEAMREAELGDLKKQVDDLAGDIKNYDPLKSTREDVESIGKDLETHLEKSPQNPTEQPAPEQVAAAEPALELNPPAAEPALPQPDAAAPALPQPDVATPAPVPAAPAPVEAAEPASTERTG